MKKKMTQTVFVLPMVLAFLAVLAIPQEFQAPSPLGEGGKWVPQPEFGRLLSDPPTGEDLCMCNMPGTCSPCWEWVEDAEPVIVAD